MEESTTPKAEETVQEAAEAPAPETEETPAETATDQETKEPPVDIPLPPATFEFLVFSLRSQAEMHLGLMNFGQEKPTVNLPLAQHSIDMLAMMAEKTKGNLSLEESRLLENSLTELRYRYVQAADAAKKG